MSIPQALMNLGLDPRGRNEWATYLDRYAAMMVPQAENAQAFQGSYLQPQMQEAYRRALGSLMNQNYAVQGDRAAAAVGDAYRSASEQADRDAAGRGFSSSFRAGQLGAGSLRGARDMAGARLSYTDGRKAQQDALQALGIAQNGVNNDPYLERFLAISGNKNNTQQVNRQFQNDNGVLGSIGSLAGLASGLGWNPLGRGGR